MKRLRNALLYHAVQSLGPQAARLPFLVCWPGRAGGRLRSQLHIAAAKRLLLKFPPTFLSQPRGQNYTRPVELTFKKLPRKF